MTKIGSEAGMTRTRVEVGMTRIDAEIGTTGIDTQAGKTRNGVEVRMTRIDVIAASEPQSIPTWRPTHPLIQTPNLCSPEESQDLEKHLGLRPALSRGPMNGFRLGGRNDEDRLGGRKDEDSRRGRNDED